MRILIGHNAYTQPGGEDAVVKTEAELLKKYGHDVRVYERRNAEWNSLPAWGKLAGFLRMDWSDKSYRELRKIIREFRPDVAHFHNTFFMMTPSVYDACRDEGVAVVQSLHNFRLLCSNALFFRDHRVCEECTTHSLWRGVRYGCYRNSRVFTALVVRMLRSHWRKKTWTDKIDAYITATEFARQKYLRAGFAPEKVTVKPNFVYPDPGASTHERRHALYVGRLSEEKGVRLLLEAWRDVKGVPLRIMGDGPLADDLKKYVADHKIADVEFLGFASAEVYEDNMRKASMLIVPSMCYENFPRVIAEAFGYGVPVVASRLGSMQELVQEGKAGLLFNHGDPQDLAKQVHWLRDHTHEWEYMCELSRREYEEKYTEQKSHEQLIGVYRKAIASRAVGR